MSALGDAPIPKRLGPFTVGRKLGAGGMATVFAARRDGAQPGDLVALKVLAPNIGADEGPYRDFMREAAIATRLEHPNIVRTHEVGQYDGLMVLSMELVHGVPLGTIQRQSRAAVPLDIALRIVSDVARALHHAHELVDAQRGPLGLVHQDVSPHNIMIGYDGVTKLVDFGVARLAMLEGSRTESLKGKPSYASPEQINGKHIDRRTDVFALGVVLWELLTGERLFRRETSAATYLAVLNDPIPDVRTRAPATPEGIAQVVARALDRHRDERFPTAEAFRLAIDEARGERIPEASQEELAFWVAQLVPPKLTFPELQRELETGDFPRSEKTPAALPADAVVPDLVVPAKRSPAAPAVAPDDALAAKPTMTPPKSSHECAPVDQDADIFDMEIERDGALAAMGSMSSYQAGARASAPRAPIAATASGLEVAHRRTTATARGASLDDEPSTRTKILANAGAAVLFAGAAAGLFEVAHRRGGRSLLDAMPHAFDGTSVVQSGIVSGVALLIAIAVGFIGLRLKPRAWSFVVSGGAMLLACLAMVTVTLVSTEQSPDPPDGALLVPWVVPVAVFAFAVGLAGRAGKLFTGDGAGPKIAAVPLAAIAGALAFLAFETSKLAASF